MKTKKIFTSLASIVIAGAFCLQAQALGLDDMHNQMLRDMNEALRNVEILEDKPEITKPTPEISTKEQGVETVENPAPSKTISPGPVSMIE